MKLLALLLALPFPLGAAEIIDYTFNYTLAEADGRFEDASMEDGTAAYVTATCYVGYGIGPLTTARNVTLPASASAAYTALPAYTMMFQNVSFSAMPAVAGRIWSADGGGAFVDVLNNGSLRFASCCSGTFLTATAAGTITTNTAYDIYVTGNATQIQIFTKPCGFTGALGTPNTYRALNGAMVVTKTYIGSSFGSGIEYAMDGSMGAWKAYDTVLTDSPLPTPTPTPGATVNNQLSPYMNPRQARSGQMMPVWFIP